MSAMSYQVDGIAADAKLQTASRRASSLHKDRVEYNHRAEASSKNRAKSAGPRGSDFSAPHRAARAATRSLLAQGAVAAGEDMPRISMGCAGTWERWIRKPAVSKSGHCATGEVDVHVFYATNIGPGAPPVTPDGGNVDSSAAFDLSLEDHAAFPVLASPCAKQGSGEAKGPILTPDKGLQSRWHRVTSDKQNDEEDEVPKDWILVAPEDVKKADVSRSVAKPAFDGQHPRNMFAKKAAIKYATSKDDAQEACGFDWSGAGMPHALIKRLIHGSANSAHRVPHTAQAAPSPPMSVLRVQNVGSAKRERSTPKSPRSNSKSRAMGKAGGRR